MLEISPQTVVQVIFLAREGGVGEAELHADLWTPRGVVRI